MAFLMLILGGFRNFLGRLKGFERNLRSGGYQGVFRDISERFRGVLECFGGLRRFLGVFEADSWNFHGVPGDFKGFSGEPYQWASGEYMFSEDLKCL